MAAITPNVVAVVRDKAHANRRVIQKPALADAYLSNIMDTFISSKHSIVQRIERSHVFSDIFVDKCKARDQDITTLVRNFRAAKHRYESWAKPLGRFTLFRNAVIATADEIATMRSGVPSADAENFKAKLDEEACLTLGLLADAADEGLLLTRSMDDELVDSATAPDTVQHFVDRIVFMFEKGHCLSMPSFTKCAVDFVAKPLLMFTKAGPRLLGGVGRLTEEIKTRCMQRLMSYVKLAIIVVRTEWPNYDLLTSFRIFNLAQRRHKVDGEAQADSEHYRNDIMRLTMTFKVNNAVFESQLDYGRPFAEREFATRKCDNREAWKFAMQSSRWPSNVEEKSRMQSLEGQGKSGHKCMGWHARQA